jgi:predicted ATP-grasp superfamily ATP-dependent carboligase
LVHDVLILGASARAAAFTALRCGLRPYCADYFADGDLAAVCPVERVDPAQAARDFVAVAESLPPSPWFYTGGLENHPDLVERIARRHRLWGVGAATLRAVRDPVEVASILEKAGIPSPEVRWEPRGLPRDGSWLSKPMASGGGQGIEPLTNEESPRLASRYFQQRVEGPSYSALFIGRGRQARWIGVTRQWIGITGSPFAYRGSLGPCPIRPALAGRLKELGDCLACAFGLVGWFGVDYVLNQGIPWPVEINPRYPASLEIYELASGRSLLEEHRRACEGGEEPEGDPPAIGLARPAVIAKRILYATRCVAVPEIAVDADPTGNRFAVPPIADIPQPGLRLEAGEPAMTLFATGADPAACRAQLARLERKWMTRLGFTTGNRTTHPP